MPPTRLNEGVVTRLEQVYPDVAAWLASLNPIRRAVVVRRVSQLAADMTGVQPGGGGDIRAWADKLDAFGWVKNSAGEWQQSEADFARVRAAFAIRDAAEVVVRDDAAADAIYESIAAVGIDAIREVLPGVGRV